MIANYFKVRPAGGWSERIYFCDTTEASRKEAMQRAMRQGVTSVWRPWSGMPAALRTIGEIHPEDDVHIKTNPRWAAEFESIAQALLRNPEK